MNFTQPVSSSDDPQLVWAKAAAAWGANISVGMDLDEIKRRACAALQGVTYP